MRALMHLRDPYALVLAAAVAIVLLVAQEGPVVALLAAASVPLVRLGAGFAVQRWRPMPPAPTPPTPPTPVPPGQPWYFPLTRRESEVAVLVAEGFTNKQVAETLHSERTVDGHLSERGVDAHVQHIMNKLSKSLGVEVNRRAQIAVWVVERRPRDLVTKPPVRTY